MKRTLEKLVKKRWTWIGFFFCLLLLAYCKEGEKEETKNSPYLNHQSGVGYVGMEVCQSCHQEVHQTFIQTGMGQSLGKATKTRSQAVFHDSVLVYDRKNDFYYRPFFRDNDYFIEEFRLKGRDTVHHRVEKLAYIIGSGHHTNSHLIDINGYVFQAPITFYTQKGIWDLAPGFGDQKNERFDRTIDAECLTCHNHFPKFQDGSINKVLEMPLGIQCERCHGPGELHAREMLAGNLVDTSKYPDYSIVNPKRLPRPLQMDLCQRCHLQGTTVLQPGKSFFDFKPGMALSEVMDVFLPRTAQSDRKFIMASQADRLRQSPCYKNSEMTCLTCHHPHQSVKSLPENYFNEKCQNCHEKMSVGACSEKEVLRKAAQNKCTSCHMPAAGSLDIPHISITDHNIQRRPAVLQAKEAEPVKEFRGLQLLTGERAKPIQMARGYLAFYDKYMEAPLILDSALYYLKKVPDKDSEIYIQSLIHYFFNRGLTDSLIEAVPSWKPKSPDAWTSYRIGEAFFQKGEFLKARQFLGQAREAMPFNLEFQEKLAACFLATQNYQEAQRILEFVISENPKRPLALTNLGFIFAAQDRLQDAIGYYDRALDLDPDYSQALLNKAAICIHQKEIPKAIQLLSHLLEKEPNHTQAKAILQQLSH